MTEFTNAYMFVSLEELRYRLGVLDDDDDCHNDDNDEASLNTICLNKGINIYLSPINYGWTSTHL